ncbi:hypothetical protein PWR63_27525 [Paraburkholderia sp. A2WS-5]|uniref:hypothetical protein n=1 Tax=unclassified Paraburkholderia TaxID=2615204 RepID=UPI003B764E83
MRLHQKGFLLDQISRMTHAWDYELVEKALSEYGASGRYAINAVRVALDELAAGGLLQRLEEKLDDGTHLGAGKVLFRYRLTDFGRARMRDTGLLTQ